MEAKQLLGIDMVAEAVRERKTKKAFSSEHR
jgi:hypothetical protein